MGKKSRLAQCVYCGQRKETTGDHVPSRNLFPDDYKKKNTIVVPSCIECNRGFSKDEEYFRGIMVSSCALGSSREADHVFWSKLKKSVERRPQIGSKLTSRMQLVDVTTRSGIYVGKATAFDVPEEDWKRCCNVLDKYVKGLFFHEFGRIVPHGYQVAHVWGHDTFLEQLKDISNWNWDNREVFAYGYNFVPRTYESIWGTIFYDTRFFLSFLAPGKYLKHIESKGR